MTSVQEVSLDTFVRAETDTMFDRLLADAGGVGRWRMHRQPSPLEDQLIIRTNRDTLYSYAVFDASAGATLTIPDSAGRYMSVMIVDQDHYIVDVLHEAGVVELVPERFDTEFAAVAVRILVDPDSPDDMATVHRVQDGVELMPGSQREFHHPAWDPESHRTIRDLVLELARHNHSFRGAFGSRDETDTLHHLLGTAAGWGGLPDSEAMYFSVEPDLPPGDYTLTVGEVPVDGFWSISVYNRDGYFEPGLGRTNVNSVTAVRNPDGTVTVHFGESEAPNTIGTPEGWSYTVRLYRPREELTSGRWVFPRLS